MIPEERNSYTLTEEEAIIFATAKFNITKLMVYLFHFLLVF
jgi:hypothetical protein